MLNLDGTSTAFGLTFREHDNRQMQHILRAYHRLPESPNVRSTLYLTLTNLENSLPDAEAQPIRDWLREGGSLSDFPGPSAAQGPPINGGQRWNPAENAFASHNPYGLFPGGFQAPAVQAGGQQQPFGWGTTTQADTDETDEANAPEDQDDDSDSDSRGDEDENGEDDDSEELEDEDSQEEDESDEEQDDEGASSDHNGLGQEREIPEGFTECCICVGQYAADNFPESLKITTTCDHDHEEVVCISCIRNTIQTGLKNGETRRIYCPLCAEYFQAEDIKKYGTAAMISRYEYLVLMATPGLVMCLGLNCGWGQVNPETYKENPVMICNSCGFKTCTFHKLPWHEGFSCEEFDCDESQIERLEADEATAKLLSQNSKICPACNQGVTKTDGCDHLQCRCGQEWCFECLTSWENIMRIGTTAHARHCSYHPDKVRLRADQEDASARNMAELVHGGPVSEALAKARVERNAKRREKLRPLALEAAEKRAQAMKKEADAKAKEKANASGDGSSMGLGSRKKPKLIAPWEEK
ncbi:hypothetical protein BKA65DRAFT_424111 [Rhexocercosporidium sp. MPI-PUGE-AT-0058]|nr:hypothetical protein BKA65DRAFT_424111 [Rhexocercosporidium sp. MPI-PUGE-AT-0058]